MRKIMAFFVVIALLIVMVGCSTGAGSSNNGGAEKNTPAGKKDQPAPTEAAKKLIVAVDPTYPPMEFLENNVMVGFSIDLTNAVAKAAGLQIEYTNIGWDNLFDSLGNGKADFINSSITVTEERKSSMLFSAPYYDNLIVIIAKKDKNIKKVGDLAGKEILIQKDTTAFDYAAKNIPSAKIKAFADVIEMLKLFDTGKYDFCLIDKPVAYDFVKKHTEYEVVTDDTAFQPDTFAYCTKLGNDALVATLNKGIKAVRDSGEYQTIYDKWFK